MKDSRPRVIEDDIIVDPKDLEYQSVERCHIGQFQSTSLQDSRYLRISRDFG
jgi:hypothetical protein